MRWAIIGGFVFGWLAARFHPRDHPGQSLDWLEH